MKYKWVKYLSVDKYYNSNLTLKHENFELKKGDELV